MKPTETDDPTAVLLNPSPPPMPRGKTVLESLTVRDYLAGQALAGLIAAHAGKAVVPNPEKAGEMAVAYADSLLVHLDRPFGE